jgi:hypothetical protein
MITHENEECPLDLPSRLGESFDVLSGGRFDNPKMFGLQMFDR